MLNLLIKNFCKDKKHIENCEKYYKKWVNSYYYQ